MAIIERPVPAVVGAPSGVAPVTASRAYGVFKRPVSSTGWRSWVFTVDHKKLGIMYGAASVIFFVIGGIEALLIRAQLAGPDGKVPPVGSTVDAANATWTNTTGAPELIAVWSDPSFDAKERAFYYARVIEIPTPRWTAYDAKRFGVAPLPGTRMTITERAYTSPIWYTP